MSLASNTVTGVSVTGEQVTATVEINTLIGAIVALLRPVTHRPAGDTEAVFTLEARDSVLQLALAHWRVGALIAVGGLEQSIKTVAGPVTQEVFSSIETLAAGVREQLTAVLLIAVVIALGDVITDVVLDEMVLFVPRTFPLI